MAPLLSVLLVDDDPTANFLHTLLLRTMGIADQVVVVENGAEALRVVSAAAPEAVGSYPTLILLDVNMPVMNGLAFAEAYARLPVTQQRAVIVLLTTSLHERDLDRASRLPIACYLDKPLTREKLLSVLHQHFPQRPSPLHT